MSKIVEHALVDTGVKAAPALEHTDYQLVFL